MENKEELEKLAAINYNLYLAGTVRRADTGEDWTYEQALQEISNFVASQKSLVDKQGYMRGVEDALKALPELNKNDIGTSRGAFRNRGWNSATNQAHDAISKLKERI